MDSKKLILFEYRDLLAAPAPSQEEMVQLISKTLNIPTEDAANLVFTDDFCAFSSYQAEKKLAPCLAGKPIGDIAACYSSAAKQPKMNLHLLKFIEHIQEEFGSQVKIGVLANAFWFSTGDMKETLPDGMFDVFFQSGDLRCRKPWPQMYELVESITGISGENVLFFDPSYTNVMGARTKGWVSELATFTMPVDTVAEVVSAFLSRTIKPAAATAKTFAPTTPAVTGDTTPDTTPAGDTEPVATEPPATDATPTPQDAGKKGKDEAVKK